MIQETAGIDRIEQSITSLLKFLTDGELILNERAPGARPQNQVYTGFMVYWHEGNAHVYRSCGDTEDERYVQRISDDSYFTARIVCYGKDALKRTSALRSALKSDIQQMLEAGQVLGICDIDDAQAIPEPDKDGGVRERAYFNFKFYAEVTHEMVMDWFNKVDIVTSVPQVNYVKVTEVVGESEGD